MRYPLFDIRAGKRSEPLTGAPQNICQTATPRTVVTAETYYRYWHAVNIGLLLLV